MEFGIFLNGYIPGPAAHQHRAGAHRAHPRSRVRDLRRQAQLEVRLVRRAPRAHRVQPHVGARGRDGLRRRADRLHPPVDRHQQPLAPQGAPGALRRARRDARPLHQPPLRVGHRPRRRQPRGRQLQHHGQELHQGRVGRGRQGDPAHVGAGRLHVPRRALHRADPAQHPAQALRQGSPADLGRVRQPAHVQPGRRARHRRHRVQLRADLQPARPHRRVQGGHRELHRARSGSSRTTT